MEAQVPVGKIERTRLREGNAHTADNVFMVGEMCLARLAAVYLAAVEVGIVS